MASFATGEGESASAATSILVEVERSISRTVSDLCDPAALSEPAVTERVADALSAQAIALGWLGIGLSGEWGGLDLGVAGLVSLHRILGARLTPGPLLQNSVAAQWIERWASPSTRSLLLQAIVAGKVRVAIPALHNADAATAPFLGTRDASHAIVPDDAKASQWRIVEIVPGAIKPSETLWDHTRQLMQLTSASCRTVEKIDDSAGNAAMDLAALLALALAAESLAAARAVSALTKEYLVTRRQFGKALGEFQALKHRMADQAVLLETNAFLLDQATDAAQRSEDMALWAFLAKASIADAFVKIAADCVQLHGGIGFSREHPCHLFLKRAHLNAMLISDSATLRDLAASDLMTAARQNRSVTGIAS